MTLAFPFSAIMGQDEMKLAILVAAIDPGIGGVLVFGDRGYRQVHGGARAGGPAAQNASGDRMPVKNASSPREICIISYFIYSKLGVG